MNATADNFRQTAARFSDVVLGVTDWDAPTPVREWTARDVVAHLTSWFPEFLQTGTELEITPGPEVGEDPVGAWTHLRDQVQALVDDDARMAMTFSHPQIGEAPLGETIDRYFTADVFMHTWDLARATGQDDTLEEKTCAEMHAGMRQMEDVLRASQQFGTEQPVRDDATEQERFIAFIGRDPYWQPA